MNFKDYNDTIFIVKDAAKEEIIKKINSCDYLLNIKIISLSEFKKKYFFDYDNETIYFIKNKYNIISSIAKIYVENLYYIKNIDDEKIQFLINIKKNLDSHQLLKYNKLFKQYLKNKKIVLYNLEFVDNFYKSTFEELRKENTVIEINDSNESDVKNLYKAKDKDEEIAFVASSIANLIKSGIDINKIKLANVEDDYRFTIYNTFKAFNIPIEEVIENTLYGSIIAQKFIEQFTSSIDDTLKNLEQYIIDEYDEKAYIKILNIVNRYAWCNDYLDVKDMITEDIKSEKLPANKLQNAVRIINFIDTPIENDEYVFLINFNQNIIPKTTMDEDYLSDNIKERLNIDTSINKNQKSIKEVRKKIKNTKNLVITYSAHNLNEELYVSNAYDDAILKESVIKINYDNSNKYNILKLVSAKDSLKKYGVKSNDLIKLSKHYKDIPYCMYDNRYKTIDLNLLKDYMHNRLFLSYTSINTYNLCAFRYYLEYILKISKVENTFDIIIGNICHKVLSECFNKDYELENEWNKHLKESNYTFSNKEFFFLNKIKKELYVIIDAIKEQMKYTNLKKSLYEKEILISIYDNIFFKGIIDKIIYDNINDKTLLAVIDYKTGNTDINIDNTYYGINMQLPIYLYLIKNSKEFKDATICGFYLQKILEYRSSIDERIDSLKLLGYSNSNINILEKFDSSYNDSYIIKSMKTTSNGFSHFAKILSDKEINNLINLVDQNIKKSSTSIMDGNFKINPKEINGILEGCKYCKFKSICYMKNEDITKLQKVNIMDYLGGEKHD